MKNLKNIRGITFLKNIIRHFFDNYFFYLVLLIIVGLPYLLHPGLYQVGRDSGFIEDAIAGNLHRLLFYWNDYDGSGTLGLSKFGNIAWYACLYFLKLFLPSWGVQLTSKIAFFSVGFWGCYLLIKEFALRFKFELNSLALTAVAFFYCTNLIAFDLYKSWLHYYYIFYFISPLLVYAIIQYQKTGAYKYLLLLTGLSIIDGSSFSNVSYISIQLMLIGACVIIFRLGNYHRIVFAILVLLLLNCASLFEIYLQLHAASTLLGSQIQQSVINDYKYVQEHYFSLGSLLAFSSGRLFAKQWSSTGQVNEFYFSDLYRSIPYLFILFVPIILVIASLWQKRYVAAEVCIFLLLSFLAVSLFGFAPLRDTLEALFNKVPLLWVYRDSLKFSALLITFACMLIYIVIANQRYWRYVFVAYLLLLNVYAFAGYFSNYYQFGSLPSDYKNLESNLSQLDIRWDEKCIIYPASETYHWYGYTNEYTGYSPVLVGLQDKLPCLSLNSKFENSSNEFLFTKFEDPSIASSADWAQYKVKYVFLHKDVNFGIFNQPLLPSSVEETLAMYPKVIETQSYAVYRMYDTTQESTSSSIIKINPTHYVAAVINLADTQTLVFNQSFDESWSLYVKKYASNCAESPNIFGSFKDLLFIFSRPLNVKHWQINNYANAWAVTSAEIKNRYDPSYYSENEDGSIQLCLDIFFTKQLYFYCGVLIAMLTVLVVCFSALLHKKII